MRNRPAPGARAICVATLGLLVWIAALPEPARGQGAAAQTCRIGVNVEDLYDIDVARDTFGAVLWLWSLCPSPELDPLATIAFPTAASIQLGEIASVDTGGSGFYRYRRVQGAFRHDWNMARYPFDDHRLVIPIDETRYGVSVVVFEADAENSFLTPGVLETSAEWDAAEFAIESSISEEARSYGLPDLDAARYARVEASFALHHAGFLTFVKLSAGVFAAAFIALLSFFYDPRDDQGFRARLALLVGTLFAALVNMRMADAVIGDFGRLTLVTEIHLVSLALIVVLAALSLRDWWRTAHGATVSFPNWRELTATSGLFVLVIAVLVVRAAW